MIDTTRINADFTQTGMSCVLSSYAIAYNYFTDRSIYSCFEDYCRHFGIPFSDSKDAETKYDAHFHSELTTRHWTGYQLVMHLHSQSQKKAFKLARKRFDCALYQNSAPHGNYLENHLRTHEAILNITFNAGPNYHSVSVFADSTSLFQKDTNQPGLLPLATLPHLGTLRDGLLHTRRQRLFFDAFKNAGF